MTWTKLSDDFSDDCWELSDAAWRLHVEGLLWSNRKLTDLRLHKKDIVRWAKHPEAAAELVACGWWQDRGTYYVVIHHGTYQRTKDAVLKQQAANQRNGKKGGRPGREQAADLKPVETQSLSESQTERDRTGLALDKSGDQRTELELLPMAAGAEDLDFWQDVAKDRAAKGNQERN